MRRSSPSAVHHRSGRAEHGRRPAPRRPGRWTAGRSGGLRCVTIRPGHRGPDGGGRRAHRPPSSPTAPRRPPHVRPRRRADAAAPDQGAVGAEAAGPDPGRPGELEPAPQGRSRPGRRRRSRHRSRAPPSRPPRRAAGRAGWPPTPPPGRRGSRTGGAPTRSASAAGRPVIAAIAVPDASASRQPRPPHAHGRPSGSTTTWPMWPALPPDPSSSRPSRTMPPPTPVDTTMAR